MSTGPPANSKTKPDVVALKDSATQPATKDRSDKKHKKHRKSKSKSKKHGRSTTGVRGQAQYPSSGNYNSAMSRNTRAFTLKSGDYGMSGDNSKDSAAFTAARAAHGDLQRAHHATVASLASIKGNFMVQQLAKASQDLKMQHELRKALEELHAKEQDFLMAVEISDKLSKDNKQLTDEIEELRLQVYELNLDNQILAEKMHAISNSYQQDMNKYQTDLIESKEIMAQLELELDHKAKLVDELEDKVVQQSNDGQNNNLNKSNGRGINGNRNKNNGKNNIAFQSISQLTSGNLNTSLEKQLVVKLEQERRRAVEQMESFMEQMDEFDKIKKQNEDLKTENEDLQEALKEQLQHQQHIQKAMQEEVIALAARNSNLEHQKDEYSKLLEQRDYEIDLLKQQIYLERKQSVVVARQLHAMSVTSETGNFEDLSQLPSISQEWVNDRDNENDDDSGEASGTDGSGDDDSGGDSDDGDDPPDNFNNNDNDDNKKNDDVDLDEINALIDDMIENDKTRKMTLKDGPSSIGNNNNNNMNDKNKMATSAVDDVFVPDVIKEYLHLTASAVKIKYPKISNVTSEELIGQAKSLPFFQYHDYMVRIMEKEVTNLEINKKKELREREQLRAIQKKKLQKRRSFLGLFGGLFGDHENENNDSKIGDNNLNPNGNVILGDNDENENNIGSDNDNNNNNNNNNNSNNNNARGRGQSGASNTSVNSPKGARNQLTTDLNDVNEDGYGSDGGYASDGNGKKPKGRHSASRFKNNKKRGLNAHASRRRLGGMK